MSSVDIFLYKLLKVQCKLRDTWRFSFHENNNHSFWRLLHICGTWSRPTSGPGQQVLQSRTSGPRSTTGLHVLVLLHEQQFPLGWRFCWPLHDVQALLACWDVWGRCLVQTLISRSFHLLHTATWLLAVFWCSQTDPWSLACDEQDHL